MHICVRTHPHSQFAHPNACTVVRALLSFSLFAVLEAPFVHKQGISPSVLVAPNTSLPLHLSSPHVLGSYLPFSRLRGTVEARSGRL